MELNKVYHMDFMDNTLPDKSVQLIIADPPYFEVKGEFDFIWASFDDYLADVEKWAQECKRLLADNGTLYWWGMDRKIAYSQVVLDKYFNLLSTIVWEKPSVANEWDTRRTFPERGQERLLYYEMSFNELADEAQRNYTYQLGLLHTKIMDPIISYLNAERLAAGYTIKMIDEATGTNMASHWFTHPSQWALPTKEWYEKLQDIFNKKGNTEYLRKDYEELRKDYEELRKDYEELRRPFNNEYGLTDIWRFSRELNQSHPTQKPQKLTRHMINISSRKGDIILAPFAGSGTECAMAVREGRKCIGFDVNAKYVDMANNRIAKELLTPTLF